LPFNNYKESACAFTVQARSIIRIVFDSFLELSKPQDIALLCGIATFQRLTKNDLFLFDPAVGASPNEALFASEREAVIETMKFPTGLSTSASQNRKVQTATTLL